jgi:predicted CXXCH cytochrome family protein
MAGTGHDFSDGSGFEGDTWNIAANNARTCNVCHTTHTGDMGVSGVPLWDHAVTSATFDVYVGTAAMQGTVSSPSGATQLCLSCHDGTLGLDSFGGVVNTTSNQMQVGNPAYVGTDLTDDHPVSVTYEGTAAGLFASPTNTATQIFEISPGVFQVECASCHEPHNSAGVGSMLVMDPANSALCTSCHNK